ncbi:MAG TPA: response regulator [Kiritimatiellia bacterium]|nr:response regulator [Kiritimatiellia bacterium]HRZ10934.1 response regulator [Kiritimatiellia bacterium]HSA18507.1 response regulator [Kiritimatiellia bacterium]
MAYILIVDDDEDFAAASAAALRKAGHEVKVETRASRALQVLEARPPDLAVLDVMFPENESAGFDLARQMRQHPALKATPILMLTAINMKFPLGFGSADKDEEWLPVTDFVEKPVDFDVLCRKVAALLAT